MLTFAVMPCLNEVEYVGEAVRSLLEPAEAESSDLTVIIVDNGSTDGTLDILADLAHRHPGRVVVEAERCRGYVPPRRQGVVAAARIAGEMSVPDSDVLILQSDADTSYRAAYVGEMRGAAESAPGALLEGSIGRSPAFEAEHPAYVEAERKIDSVVEPLEVADEDDVVVDDKVCAYRLSDYMSWGGLFEERSDVGDPIHAETTRMFIRARLRTGVPKVRVNRAGAFPSRRRVLENPRYHFATLGFPRERTWADRTASGWSASDVDAFAQSVLAGYEKQAVALRVRHLLALFRFLPAIILAAMGSTSALLAEPDVAAALELVPRRERDELAERPALAILDVLGLIDEHPEVFLMMMRLTFASNKI